VGKMSLFFNLPKEVKREEFDEFLEKITSDFPASEFPEIFIHYTKVNDKVLVLGIGKSAECGEQAYRAYQENPSLRKHESTTRILRAPKKRFLLR
jgi:hypothetical protein